MLYCEILQNKAVALLPVHVNKPMSNTPNKPIASTTSMIKKYLNIGTLKNSVLFVHKILLDSLQDQSRILLLV